MLGSTFFQIETQRITTLTMFLLQRRLLLFEILSSYQRTHTRTRGHTYSQQYYYSTFYNEALIACSFARFLLLCGFLWVFDHASIFCPECIAERKINPEVFPVSVFRQLICLFRVLMSWYTQVHFKSIISFCWRYVINEMLEMDFRLSLIVSTSFMLTN